MILLAQIARNRGRYLRPGCLDRRIEDDRPAGESPDKVPKRSAGRVAHCYTERAWPNVEGGA
jgi:hypothetical protein